MEKWHPCFATLHQAYTRERPHLGQRDIQMITNCSSEWANTYQRECFESPLDLFCLGRIRKEGGDCTILQSVSGRKRTQRDERSDAWGFFFSEPRPPGDTQEPTTFKVKWRYIKFALAVLRRTSQRVRPTPLTLSTSSMHNSVSEPKDDNEERKEEEQR